MNRLPLFLLMIPLFLACKAAPPAPPPPSPPEKEITASLALDEIEGQDVDRVILKFSLKVENPRSQPVSLNLRGMRLLLNGGEAKTALVHLEENGAAIAAGSSAVFPLRVEMDLKDDPAQEAAEEYTASVRLDLAYTAESGIDIAGEVSASVIFPRIHEPVFTITNIAILKAELINTRFRVRLRIDNPNNFPLELSGMNYELYGGGRFWAGGVEKDILHIPASSSAETRLNLVMNFIDMKRDLLNQVITQRQVLYRFTGSADISTGQKHLPRFRAAFDRSGLSEVIE
ncbi:hypothetical protein AGMMS49928_04190 [Spirochaetia bacterium]|nr:hypothetical protein AGMMS49928_04190 [Spirochaetia bacterium]